MIVSADLRETLSQMTVPPPEFQAQLDRIEEKLDRIIARMFAPEERGEVVE